MAGPPTDRFSLLEESALQATASTLGPFTPTGGATLAFQPGNMVNGVVYAAFGLSIPSLGFSATDLSAARGGLLRCSTDGRTATLEVDALNYTLFAFWNIQSAAGVATYTGLGISGDPTPASSVPTSGTGNYVGSGTNGLVLGSVYWPNGSGGPPPAPTGQANLAVTFGTGTVTGSLSNMTVTPAGGTASPWNTVNLNGNLLGANLSGTTSVTASTGTTNLNLSTGASGTFNGSLFGPNAEEAGAVWTLIRPRHRKVWRWVKARPSSNKAARWLRTGTMSRALSPSLWFEPSAIPSNAPPRAWAGRLTIDVFDDYCACPCLGASNPAVCSSLLLSGIKPSVGPLRKICP